MENKDSSPQRDYMKTNSWKPHQCSSPQSSASSPQIFQGNYNGEKDDEKSMNDEEHENGTVLLKMKTIPCTAVRLVGEL